MFSSACCGAGMWLTSGTGPARVPPRPWLRESCPGTEQAVEGSQTRGLLGPVRYEPPKAGPAGFDFYFELGAVTFVGTLC